MRSRRGCVFMCVGLVCLFCLSAEAKNESDSKTVVVDCDKGDSINDALEEKAEELIVEISGTCQEDGVIERNNVTLRGVTPGATVVAASSAAIFLDRVSRVSLENLSVQGGTEEAGVLVWQSTGISVSDLVVEEGGSKGMTVVGSTVIFSDSVFRYNNGYGLQANASDFIFLEGEVELSGNSYEGLLLSFQSSLNSLAASLPSPWLSPVYDHHNILTLDHRAAEFLLQVARQGDQHDLAILDLPLPEGSKLLAVEFEGEVVTAVRTLLCAIVRVLWHPSERGRHVLKAPTERRNALQADAGRVYLGNIEVSVPRIATGGTPFAPMLKGFGQLPGLISTLTRI